MFTTALGERSVYICVIVLSYSAEVINRIPGRRTILGHFAKVSTMSYQPRWYTEPVWINILYYYLLVFKGIV